MGYLLKKPQCTTAPCIPRRDSQGNNKCLWCESWVCNDFIAKMQAIIALQNWSYVGFFFYCNLLLSRGMIWVQVLYTHAVVLLLLIPFACPEPSFGSFTWKLATMCCKREISSLLLAGYSVLHWKWETEPCVFSQSGSVVLQFCLP